MPVVRAAQARRTRTPNGVMTTLASPTQGAAGHLLWRVELEPGRTGPFHAFDAEQIWSVLEGGATVELGDERFRVGPGDTVVMPAGLPRQVTTTLESGLTAVVTAPTGTLAYNPTGVTEPDACELAPRDTERTAPPWTL
ncbi:cupin domain-containing protein [Streptomyces sp. MST-110588]|uniref:cupin domain-containing protein n=1 Tax=Streptomyces sp. MST-110588 TaxID=2833628 RepID=UPI001F5C6EAF|nr:cupin domain-containing protein [Streptomyces sp. MST-110588]UNO40880.1 cupin domain-containing protein [Streptomyces sp. MST-110588]